MECIDLIRPLDERDAEACAALRREALADSPLSFARSLDDDPSLSADVWRERLQRAPNSVVFGAFDGGLVGFVGVQREERIKSAHKAYVGGMYVTPSRRRRGIGRRLLEAAIAHAHSLPGVSALHLSVSSAAGPARKLYERAGFREWGAEQDGMRYGGKTVVLYHMALALGTGAP